MHRHTRASRACEEDDEEEDDDDEEEEEEEEEEGEEDEGAGIREEAGGTYDRDGCCG